MSSHTWFRGVLAASVAASSTLLQAEPQHRAERDEADFGVSTLPSFRPALQPALRDPFVLVRPPAPPAPPPVAVKEPPPPPPAPPAPPPLNLQFAGRMTGPDGALVVFAAQGPESLALRAGVVLPNGYRVDKVTPDLVHLTHTGLNVPAEFPLPPAPAFEIR